MASVTEMQFFYFTFFFFLFENFSFLGDKSNPQLHVVCTKKKKNL